MSGYNDKAEMTREKIEILDSLKSLAFNSNF